MVFLFPWLVFADGTPGWSTGYAAASVFAGFFGLGLIAGLIYFKHGRGARIESPADFSSDGIVLRESVPPPRGRQSGMPTPEGGIDIGGLEPLLQKAEVMHPPSKASRTCPTCTRSFDDSIVICPYDSTPLTREAPRKMPAEPLGVPGCRRCGRYYSSGTSFCRHDGSRLESEAAVKVRVVTVCRSCGSNQGAQNSECEGGCDWIKVDPMRTRFVMSPIPLMECPACYQTYSMDHARCERDGQVLRPLMNLTKGTLPPTGYGPRRRVCTECGTTYSGSSRYCAHDGHILTDLN